MSPRTPAVPGGNRIPGNRTLAVTTATALTAVGLSLMPDGGRDAAALDITGPCAIAAAEGFGEGPMSPDYIRPTGHRKATMIMVDFPDIPATGNARERADFFAAYGDRYLDLASYGTYDLELVPTPEWIRMPKPWTAYGVKRGISSATMQAYVQDAIDAARARGTDFGDSDFVYVVADENVPARPTVSQANVFENLRAGDHRIRAAALVFGRGNDSATWQRGNFVHEANHLYGLPDLYNSRNGASVEYAGGWDTMSMAGISDLIGWHKWKFGWLADEQVACVPAGTSSHTLRPIGAPGANIAVVKTGPTSAVVAETRTRTGLDKDICTEGVLVYTVDSSVPTGRGPVRVVDSAPHSKGGTACASRSPAELAELGDAPFGVDESHTFANGVRIGVTGREDDGSHRVRITKPALTPDDPDATGTPDATASSDAPAAPVPGPGLHRGPGVYGVHRPH
ncbi:peptidase M6 [Streptomyces sp. JJ36]|uniref:peptidase M6 n=1 Tax=Streptomyces sp. JJ36 TaxID=2736645 RepID=UPI001F32961C|nr:peptidase M6 [Streptomyces sp. JJ36]MCF6523039.1 peptidase M6 [Streptomyces sp. JJ36]